MQQLHMQSGPRKGRHGQSLPVTIMVLPSNFIFFFIVQINRDQGAGLEFKVQVKSY